MPDIKKWSDSRAPAGRIAYVNGRYLPHGQAAVHIEDRGLQLGDSIYEVTNVLDGVPIDEAAHLDRMERSLGALGIAMPMGRAALSLVMREMIARNRIRDGLLYLQVTRGAVRRDHIPPHNGPRPTLIMTMRSQDMAGLAARYGKGRGRRHGPGPALGPLRYQDGAAAAQPVGQAGGKGGRRL